MFKNKLTLILVEKPDYGSRIENNFKMNFFRQNKNWYSQNFKKYSINGS